MVAKFISSFFNYRFSKNNLIFDDILNISTKLTLYCTESFGYHMFSTKYAKNNLHTSLWLQFDQMSPHFFSCVCVVPNLCIRMQSKNLWRIGQG